MSFSEILQNFHFIRPWLLLLLPVGLLLGYMVRHKFANTSNWSKVIDPTLLPYLLDGESEKRASHLPLLALLLAWSIACVAIAGPTWEKVEQPVVKKQNALVIILDMTLSMYAEDQKPSRLVAAKRKVDDILAQRKEGVTGLVVFSGDAHTVAPLTDDIRTIANMLPALEPNIMPKFGNNVGAGIRQANELIKAAGIHKAQYLLLADELSPSQFNTLKSDLPSAVDLSVISFGTPSGAPIPLSGGFLKDKAGNLVIAKTDINQMRKDSLKAGFGFAQSTVSDSDINHLLITDHNENSQTDTVDRQFDLWKDQGYWLVYLLLPVVLLSFRRGWILLLLVIVLPHDAYSLSWDDLWQTQDQQAAQKLESGNAEQAAEQFNNPRWQSTARYRAGDYEGAMKAIETLENKDSEDYYNQGNALARMNKLDDAIAAYDKALEFDPDNEDAAFNKALIEKIKQQQQQNQENQDNNEQNGEQNQDQQQNSGQQENQQQQSGEGENAEQNSEQQENQQGENAEQNQNQSGEQSDQQQESEQQSGQSEENSEQNPEESAQQAEQGDKDQEGAENEQQAAQQQEEQQQEEQERNPEGQSQAAQPMTAEEQAHQQALKQWLRRIPDDSGLLLKNKFRHQYQQNLRKNEHIDKDSDQLW